MYACRYRFQDTNAVTEFLDGYGPDARVDHGMLWDLSWVRRVRATCTRAHRGDDVDERLATLVREAPKGETAGLR